jgi:hypothetical protein
VIFGGMLFMTKVDNQNGDPTKSIPKGSPDAPPKDKTERREIKGNIPYVVAPGTLKKVLDQIIVAERPDKFGANYMETILKMTGGISKCCAAISKKDAVHRIGQHSDPTLFSFQDRWRPEPSRI